MELLIYAGDISDRMDLSLETRATAPKKFDVVVCEADGHPWGQAELTNPLFRIIAWPDAPEAYMSLLTAAQVPTMTEASLPNTYAGYRGFFADLLNPALDAAYPDAVTWWRDETRQQPIYTIPVGSPVNIADLITERPHISIGS